MKRLICYVLLFGFFSCQNKQNNQSKSTGDSAVVIPKQETKIISDSTALPLSKEILSAVKNKDYKKFASFIDAEAGIRFSPYGYIDTVHDKRFTPQEFLNFTTDKKTIKFTWGVFDGSGDKILLTIDEYFKKFVYDVDFLNAPEISLNKTASKGNSLNNIDSVYKKCVYTEFYFPGFDKKYEGMDWRSLKLVFKKENNNFYLVAIVHDKWMI
jgi:hypothetical protein